jgi:hypothetical protein
MNNIFLDKIYIRYKNDLINYKYCDYDNINNLSIGLHIQYICKKNLLKKSGFLKDIKNNSILELTSLNKKNKWYIYINQYYIFYKVRCNKLKNTLLYLLDNNFNYNELL